MPGPASPWSGSAGLQIGPFLSSAPKLACSSAMRPEAGQRMRLFPSDAALNAPWESSKRCRASSLLIAPCTELLLACMVRVRGVLVENKAGLLDCLPACLPLLQSGGQKWRDSGWVSSLGSVYHVTFASNTFPCALFLYVCFLFLKRPQRAGMGLAALSKGGKSPGYTPWKVAL